MYPCFWPKIPKAKLLGNLATVSSGRADSYETDLDFWPKNPKANL